MQIRHKIQGIQKKYQDIVTFQVSFINLSAVRTGNGCLISESKC